MPTKEGTRTGPSDPRSEQSADEVRRHPARSYGGVDINSRRASCSRTPVRQHRRPLANDEAAARREALQHYSDRATARARED